MPGGHCHAFFIGGERGRAVPVSYRGVLVDRFSVTGLSRHTAPNSFSFMPGYATIPPPFDPECFMTAESIM